MFKCEPGIDFSQHTRSRHLKNGSNQLLITGGPHTTLADPCEEGAEGKTVQTSRAADGQESR